MQKRWIACVALVLALAFPCLGGVLRNQGFTIGSNNGAGLLGAGVATSANVLTAHNLQHGSDKTGMIRTVQAETGALGQVAAVGAVDGFFNVSQYGGVNATQSQAHPGGVGGASLGTQFQGLGVDLDQTVEAAKGSHGLAMGLQTMVGVQVQVIATPWGVNLNVQPVIASVYDAVGLK